MSKYRVIYADPPWQYGERPLEDHGPVTHDFAPMSVEELCALPVKELAEKDAVLFLWVPSTFLEEAYKVVKAWGFKYKTSFVWNKKNGTHGYFVQTQHEFLLICTRGSCLPDVKKKLNSVVEITWNGKSSEKPEAFRQIIDFLYPNGRRIELFTTKPGEGWDTPNTGPVKEDGDD